MDLIADLQAAGLPAVGLSGQDSGLLRSRRRPPVSVDGEMVDFGWSAISKQPMSGCCAT